MTTLNPEKKTPSGVVEVVVPEAVAYEREACAKIADELMDGATGASREAFRILADRIRKRGL